VTRYVYFHDVWLDRRLLTVHRAMLMLWGSATALFVQSQLLNIRVSQIEGKPTNVSVGFVGGGYDVAGELHLDNPDPNVVTCAQATWRKHGEQHQLLLCGPIIRRAPGERRSGS
jgi:hypothetical protein